MHKCNVANGFCGAYNKERLSNCYVLHMDEIKNCKHRKRMNRLGKKFKDDIAARGFGVFDSLYFQWEKEGKYAN